MRLRFHQLCLAGLASAAIGGGAALAGPALDDGAAGAAADPTDPAAAVAETGTPVEWGIGIRFRNVRAPQGLLELFVERAPGGTSNYGIGVDFVRRRGDIELQLGFEYERIEPPEGVWIERNTNVANDEVDYILSPESNNDKTLGWLTAEFTFLSHAKLAKGLALRYGGGAGVGVVLGELGRYDVRCAAGATNESPEPGCVPMQRGGTGTATSGTVLKYNLPPVFPVVNAILGLQLRPTAKMTINVEGGIRTFPFFGISGGYFF